jgi:hypothetical protein
MDAVPPETPSRSDGLFPPTQWTILLAAGDVAAPKKQQALDQLSHAEAAQRLGKTEKAVRQAVYRLRKRFRELLRMEVAAAGTSEAEIDDEIRYLMAVISRE